MVKKSLGDSGRDFQRLRKAWNLGKSGRVWDGGWEYRLDRDLGLAGSRVRARGFAERSAKSGVETDAGPEVGEGTSGTQALGWKMDSYRSLGWGLGPGWELG